MVDSEPQSMHFKFKNLLSQASNPKQNWNSTIHKDSFFAMSFS